MNQALIDARERVAGLTVPAILSLHSLERHADDTFVDQVAGARLLGTLDGYDRVLQLLDEEIENHE